MFQTYIAQNFCDYELDGLSIIAYDEKSGSGFETIRNNTTVSDVISRDTVAELDWLVDCTSTFSTRIQVGNLIAVEAIHILKEVVASVKDNCFLWTKQGWAWLVNRSIHTVEILGEIRTCWIAEVCSFEDVGLARFLTDEGQRILSKPVDDLSIKTIYARSVSAMELLDGIHREYIYKHSFAKGDVMAISSVAGSGKTTMLLKLSAIHNEKKVLYLAFNKSLVTDIREKISKQKIRNMSAMTFDALLWNLFCQRMTGGVEPKLSELKPQNIAQYISWFENKPFKLKKAYCKYFSAFCLDIESITIEDWCKRVLKRKDVMLEKLWQAALNFRLVSFETIRKMAFLGNWFKGYIDLHYDMILCDETQDFDMIMLRMLLDDTTLPRVFVGDPKQSIYDFRGCINAFKYMPSDATVVEFYSTFRIGEPACSQIRTRIPNLWMISKARRQTEVGGSINGGVWLFRAWKTLFQVARITRKIWIYGFELKLNQIWTLHEKLNSSWFDDTDIDDMEDDLPKFLKSISKEELAALISDIEQNIVGEGDADWKMYTVHSYKGMENDNIRMATDITLDEENLYYVAITRGMKQIAIDVGEISPIGNMVSNTCSGKGECIKECFHKQHVKTDYGSKGYCPSTCKHKCQPVKCIFWTICRQKRPQYILDSSKGQCFDCRLGI